MFIWAGIDVDDQLKAVKASVKEAENKLDYSSVYSSLPYHISLKMPFYLDDGKVNDVIESILGLYEKAERIKAGVRGIEKESGIVWIKMFENGSLNSLCDELNEMLKTEHGVEIQEYDVDHEFHVTLFIEDDEQFIGQAFGLVKDADMPQELLMDKLVVGVSETGEPGTYKYVLSE